MDTPEIKRFGRYEIVAELGRGAMGVVYQARDPQIDRMVAVKSVSLWGQEPDEEKEFRLRFMHEAQAAGRLHHPGIVAIFDVGENPENQNPFIVLEYVAGEPLNRILARERKLPLEKALQIALEIAEALDYAHAQGVIHRDIKPGNILITHDGHAKIADFGIAKLNLAHFTLPGKVLGTPAYMAPEQLAGEGVDGRSDLFSLGVILYAMVTGHSPFQGDSATTVCFKVANREPVAASALDLDVPRELDEVISRAMAKDPEQRYQRGAEFSEDLRQMQQFASRGSTTSLRPLSATTTRFNAMGTTSNPSPAVEMAQAQKMVHTIVQKAPIRDLILGAAILIVLIFVGAQTKLLVISPRTGESVSSDPSPNAAEKNPNHATAALEKDASSAVTNTSAVQTQSNPARTTSRKKRSASQTAKPIVVPSSTLDLAVQHQFKDATLYLWVDDKLMFTRPLHGAAQKRMVVFNGLKGAEQETLQIPAGKHVLHLRALSADDAIDLSKTVSVEFVGGGHKSLQVNIDKHNTVMRLTWE
jgi:serine/threonine-protein kinase